VDVFVNFNLNPTTFNNGLLIANCNRLHTFLKSGELNLKVNLSVDPYVLIDAYLAGNKDLTKALITLLSDNNLQLALTFPFNSKSNLSVSSITEFLVLNEYILGYFLGEHTTIDGSRSIVNKNLYFIKINSTQLSDNLIAALNYLGYKHLFMPNASTEHNFIKYKGLKIITKKDYPDFRSYEIDLTSKSFEDEFFNLRTFLHENKANYICNTYKDLAFQFKYRGHEDLDLITSAFDSSPVITIIDYVYSIIIKHKMFRIEDLETFPFWKYSRENSLIDDDLKSYLHLLNDIYFLHYALLNSQQDNIKSILIALRNNQLVSNKVFNNV
jgi:hypothetical protein